MSLTPLDANMIFGLGAFVFFQLAKRSGSPEYKRQRKLITLGPPSWVFGVMWTIIYTFLTVSAYYAFTTVTTNYTAMICVFFVNIMLNKYWSVLFFDYDQHLLALFVLLGMLGTSGAFLAFAWNGDPKGFYLHLFPYVPWCLVATIWNIQIVAKQQRRVWEEEEDTINSEVTKRTPPVLPITMKSRIVNKAPPIATKLSINI